MRENILEEAYNHCAAIAHHHYENFPVASRFLPGHLRAPISTVYAFSRSADDFADEGNLTPQQRLDHLNQYDIELQKIAQGDISDELIFIALGDVINRYDIPISLFHDLLHAFKTDVVKHRYQTFSEVLDYCRFSANPVGRILLYLNNSVSKNNTYCSDAICTGLQLINFHQDITQDLKENNRLYIPLEDLQKFRVSEQDLKLKINNSATRNLMEFELKRVRTLYTQGQPLCQSLSGRFGFEIRMIFAGGLKVLQKLENNTHDIYSRPRLNTSNKLAIIREAIFMC